MTKQKSFKRRVRARMEKTGESYTAARRMLIADGDKPDQEQTQATDLPVSEEKLVEATGRPWAEWLGVLDEWGARDRTHTQIARWLLDEREVPGWYAQAITVGYERARGMRAVGQRSDGFVAGVTRTIAVSAERIFDAWEDEALRGRWLPAGGLSTRTATRPKSARYDWEDGSTRVIVSFEQTGESKSRVAVSHERLPDAETADAMKAWWRERLAALKGMLEAA